MQARELPLCSPAPAGAGRAWRRQLLPPQRRGRGAAAPGAAGARSHCQPVRPEARQAQVRLRAGGSCCPRDCFFPTCARAHVRPLGGGKGRQSLVAVPGQANPHVCWATLLRSPVSAPTFECAGGRPAQVRALPISSAMEVHARRACLHTSRFPHACLRRRPAQLPALPIGHLVEVCSAPTLMTQTLTLTLTTCAGGQPSCRPCLLATWWRCAQPRP